MCNTQYACDEQFTPASSIVGTSIVGTDTDQSSGPGMGMDMLTGTHAFAHAADDRPFLHMWFSALMHTIYWVQEGPPARTATAQAAPGFPRERNACSFPRCSVPQADGGAEADCLAAEQHL